MCRGFPTGQPADLCRKKEQWERDVVVGVEGRDAPEIFNKDHLCSGELEYLSGPCMLLSDICSDAKCTKA